jgi:tetratricopeptide (TPR) repeat protein
MKKIYIIIMLSLFIACVSCVQNPNVTEEDYLSTPNAASSWITGLKRKIALMLNATVVNMEIASDNYYNNYSQYSKVFDKTQISYTDVDVNTIQSNIHQVRAMAQFGIDRVIPGDPNTTQEQKAYIYFALAYSHLLAGELFTGLPASERGEVLSWENHLTLAVENFQKAIELDTDEMTKQACRLFIARAYYRLGDIANAVNFANMVKNETQLLYEIKFDGTNGVSNEMQNAIYDAATPNRLAPLPRLDFLDPKYYSAGTASAGQKSIAIAKVEEACLIIAEAQASNNQITDAKSTLQSLLLAVAARPVVMIDDSRETRNGGNRHNYPLENVYVKFDSNSPAKSGYVLNRQNGNIPAYTVSGTSVTNMDIDACATQDELLYIIYLLRQEIFMAEGRRISDLGIRMPVSQNEQMSNPNVTDVHIQAQIPSFIPQNEAMDDFTCDDQNGLVTIKYDMNKTLVQNKTSPYIMPFIK